MLITNLTFCTSYKTRAKEIPLVYIVDALLLIQNSKRKPQVPVGLRDEWMPRKCINRGANNFLGRARPVDNSKKKNRGTADEMFQLSSREEKADLKRNFKTNY